MQGGILIKGLGAFALAAALLWPASQESRAQDALAEATGAQATFAAATSVRMLQSELMVAALACHGGLRTNLVERYNAFVHRFAPALIRSADTLRDHFRQTYGAKHRIRFDSFLTRLANQASLNSIRETGFCEARAQLAETALDLDAGDLERFTIATYTENLAAFAEDLPPTDADRRLAAQK